LVLLGSAGALALSACDGDPGPQTQVFQDEAQCAKSNDANDCRQALADAREAHRTTAPAFASRETCEAQFGVGNCGPAEAKPTPEQVARGEGPQAAARTATAGSGGSFFMPLLLGYMMGNTFGGAGQPVWRDARNTAYVGGRPAGTIDPANLARSRATGTPVQVARGGFGGSAVGSATS
jgi:uncharacterized protein YgiB involved in biofilm formation